MHKMEYSFLSLPRPIVCISQHSPPLLTDPASLGISRLLVLLTFLLVSFKKYYVDYSS